ncbi:hypothetical protein QR680_007381 [Steinernema hermaphroditum]|uniref:FAM69 protein-kinase domain-containing protein n=1 Tax=Steinernema hermaphroditum TaxID=289476 RepID=A0AA39IFI3_9BILA|nr:hypothetical protein QR680_007381 [Steinernema hermaphroditum]
MGQIFEKAYLSLMHAISGASTSSSLAFPYRTPSRPSSKYGGRRQTTAAEDVLQLVNQENSDSDSDSDTDIISLCCGSGGCCGCAAGDGTEKSSNNGAASGFSPKVLFCSKPGRLLIFIMSALFLYLLYTGLILSNAASSSGRHAGSDKPKFNHSKATEVLNRLCGQYSEGKVTGSVCDSVCTRMNYTIKDFYEGNKVVLTLKDKDRDKTIILKSLKPYIEDYDEVDPRVEEEHFTDKIVEIVNDQLMLGFPLAYKNHVLQLLWPIERANSSVGRRQKRPSMTQAERRSLWALMQQEEYMNFRILPLSRVVPKIQGTCGHFYQPEYLVPFHMKGYYVNLKAKILVHLMGTLKLFYEFLNEPLQWCDVKFDNMGLSSEYPKRFVIMDSDMLYTESKLHQLLTSRRCSTDDDCQYFDCHAQCNTTKGFCTSRTNDNIDVFCNKLVTQLFGTFWTKSNRYLAACHDESHNSTQRLADLRLVWSWNLSDV